MPGRLVSELQFTFSSSKSQENEPPEARTSLPTLRRALADFHNGATFGEEREVSFVRRSLVFAVAVVGVLSWVAPAMASKRAEDREELKKALEDVLKRSALKNARVSAQVI